jgi:hypothetical protein
MLKDKENQLKQRLSNIISNMITMQDKDTNIIKAKIADEFKARNMSPLRATWLLSENLDINTLSETDDDLLFMFLFTVGLSKGLAEVTEDIKLDVQEYFTQSEYKAWIDFKATDERESIYPIVLKDVQQIAERIWQTTMTAQDLNRLDADNLLIYNFKTQRNPKITAAGEKINMDKDKVQQIKERMLNGEQYPDHIKLNILRSIGDASVVQYNERNQTLVINEGAVINIFDGYHRKTANALAVELNPEILFKWGITITNLSEKQAHDYMVQIDKQKKIKTEYIQQMDYTKAENLVIDAILDDKFSELAKVMKDDDAYIRKNKGLTKKSIVATAIKEIYDDMLGTSYNLRNIAKWIIEVTDYLMGLYDQEFIVSPYEVRKTSYINHKNMFVGYIALTKSLYGKKDWKEKLKQKIASIDFNKGNSMWRDLGLVNEIDPNKTLRKKLYQLFGEDSV